MQGEQCVVLGGDMVEQEDMRPYSGAGLRLASLDEQKETEL